MKVKTEMQKLEEIAEALDVLYPDLGDDFRHANGLYIKGDEPDVE